MNLHLIRTIAAYERRTILRSWFFRIFAAGSIFALGIFNLAINVAASGAPAIYRALPSSVPYLNLIILNIGQAIVAIFLGSEFLKQDRKNDTIEVIYARSMTNGEYIAGKSLGILSVFIALNIIILLIGVGFSFISNVTNQNILAYFTYILLISIPTLVFILGLSFFTMVLVKNQAVTFIILTGYIALTVFYLSKKAYNIFDYIAYQVPMLYSTIAGFSQPLELLIHRGIYFLLGLGLILLTIHLFRRLPQSKVENRIALAAGVGLVLMASMFAVKYIDMKTSVYRYRDTIAELNNAYNDYLLPSVDSCSIDLKHQGKTIDASTTLFIRNEENIALDTLIFSLNPGLKINKLLLEGNPVAFEREMHIVIVVPQQPLQPGESAVLKFEYTGRINENVAFIDLSNEKFTENPAFEIFRLDKRIAFVEKDYVLLTSEVLWYPVAGPGYASETPMLYDPSFVNFSLKVTTRDGLTSISQGKSTSIGDGSVIFRPEYALPEISLVIGDYLKYSVTVDSIEYSIYTIRGNDYFSRYFTDLIDTIPTLIAELKNDYEAVLGMQYPFRRLMFTEVPVQFSLDNHLYSFASDAVQPEMILCPEKGILLRSADFRTRKYRIERDLKNRNEEVLPEVVQADMFKEFLRNNFISRRERNFNYEHIIKWHTFSVFPQYLSFYNRISSKQWPVLTMALETYLSERNNPQTTTLLWYEDLSEAEKINLELKDATLEEVLIKGVESKQDERNPIALMDVVQVKGLALFNKWGSKSGSEKLDTIINRILREHPHQKIPFSVFSERVSTQMDIDVPSELNTWYRQRNLPGFLIRNIRTYKVALSEMTRYQVKFQISNPEETDGSVTVHFEFSDPNRQRNIWDPGFNIDFSAKIFLPAKSSFEAGYVFNSEPARMSVVTHISKNLPNNLVYNFSGFTETRNVAGLDSVIPIPFFSKVAPENEIIADNEDDGFSFQQAQSQAYLKSLVNRKKSDRYKYSSIWWNPPKEWKAVLRSEFFGHYVRSAYYTRGGTGERTATWKAVLPSAGQYDVYFHVDKVNVGWRRNNRASNYNLTVYHDQGADKIDHPTEETDPGWNYLGTWYISSDTARVDVSNKTNGEMIFADAVKWVLRE